ncbi:DUF421 domain-containing protein [Niallia endozanthoxylica]|uniref:DUF421 domain-containing protein n=1 Tax=Niallia endozanthoxylica TaxID=2036016 RepID=A0A5J5GW47_9BACI|nr:DUF421 domain-containing protein [Niallia endozanthoxylica]KAA9012227.1 DUF421 domain-containing protein [Niallia endozanthoxylica]
MNFVWESLLLILTGILLLRVAGRKSISQMTLAQTVVMISIGSIIIQPIVETSVWRTIVAAAIFIAALITLEYLQIKFNAVEKFITGKSKVVIQNGSLDTDNLRKLRMTADQLEMRLRQQGITSIQHVKTATLEPNGQLGYELMPDAQPLTVGEFKRLMPMLLNPTPPSSLQQNTDIFSEVVQEQHRQEHPKYLQ